MLVLVSCWILGAWILFNWRVGLFTLDIKNASEVEKEENKEAQAKEEEDEGKSRISALVQCIECAGEWSWSVPHVQIKDSDLVLNFV